MSFNSSKFLERHNQVSKIVDEVNNPERLNLCARGKPKIHVLDLTLDYEFYNFVVEATLIIANYISKLLALKKNLSKFQNIFLYALAGHPLSFDKNVYGCSIAFEDSVFPSQFPNTIHLFKTNVTNVRNLSEFYDHKTASWYTDLKDKGVHEIIVRTSLTSISNASPPQKFKFPFIREEDGMWTKPYYDCGGGGKFKFSFVAPIVGYYHGYNTFKGVTKIDLKLTSYNIDQCQKKSKKKEEKVNIFTDTNHCQPTTQCIREVRGFQIGSYNCRCKDGYYFPNSSSEVAYFSGREIEEYFDHAHEDNTSFLHHSSTEFNCLACAENCAKCTDDTPCMYGNNMVLRYTLFIILVFMIMLCILMSICTFRHREHVIIKMSNPFFLHIVCIGGIIVLASNLHLLILRPNAVACMVRNVSFYLGFNIMYGALLLKIWRVSILLTTAHPNPRQMTRIFVFEYCTFIILVAISLAVWNGMEGVSVSLLRTINKKLFYHCQQTEWKYAFKSGMFVLLIACAYLCHTLKKVSTILDEGKYINWAIYNCGLSIIVHEVLSVLVGVVHGPDVLAFIRVAELMCVVPVTILLVFIPKLRPVYVGTSREVQMIARMVNHRLTGAGITSVACQTDETYPPSMHDSKKILSKTDLSFIAKPKTLKAIVKFRAASQAPSETLMEAVVEEAAPVAEVHSTEV